MGDLRIEKEVNNNVVPPKEAPKELVVEGKKAIQIQEHDDLIIKQRLQAINKVAVVIKNELKRGYDYGVIPGTSKPTLFKAGAQKICLMYGLRAFFEFKKRNEESQYKSVTYTFKCFLKNSKEQIIAEGYGLCSSNEKKYITQNPNDIENTILKMAKKRALVDATIAIGNLSETFTQDIEDMKLRTSGSNLSKEEKLGLYSLAYAFLKPIIEAKNDVTEGKKAAKLELEKNIFPKLGINKPNFMMFDRTEAKKFKDFIKKERAKKS